MVVYSRRDLVAAKREARIFETCGRLAREIVAELEASGGDHSEDCEILCGLIEGWEVLRFAQEEEAENVCYYLNRVKAGEATRSGEVS